MKKIFTSDLNVLIQLYAPKNYLVQVFDPFCLLEEDEELKYQNGDATGISSIKVYDVTGNVISDLSYQILEQKIRLNCNLISPGAYLVVVQDDENGLFTGRLIIQ